MGPRYVAQFLGQSPDWYKLALLVFLVVNPIIFFINPFIAGWLLVAEFILRWRWHSSVIRCCRVGC